MWSQGQATTEGEDNLPVVKTDIGRVGGLICWESESIPIVTVRAGLTP